MANNANKPVSPVTPYGHQVVLDANIAKAVLGYGLDFSLLENETLDLNGRPYRFSQKGLTGCLKAVTTAASKEAGAITHGKIRAIIAQTPMLVEMSKDERAVAPILPSYPVLYTGRVGNEWIDGSPMTGVKMVIGGTGSGKSTMIAKTLKPDVMLRYSEPHEDYDLLGSAFAVNGLKEALEVSILLSLLGQKVALDSLRGLVTELRGAATEGGIIGALYTQVTDLNNLIANFGVNVVMTMNPMVKKEVIQTLYDGVAASATASILLEDYQITRSQFRTVKGRVIDKHDNERSTNVEVTHVNLQRVPTIDGAVEESASLGNLEVTKLTGRNESDLDLISQPREAAAFDLGDIK